MPQKSCGADAFAVCIGLPFTYSMTLCGQTSTHEPHSQQLPYATTSFIICLKVERSGVDIGSVVADQRVHRNRRQALPTAQEAELDQERAADDGALETAHQVERRARGSAGREQIVDQQHAVSLADGVLV